MLVEVKKVVQISSIKIKGRGEKASKDTIRKVKSIAESLELLKRAKSNKDKLKAFLGASLEPTNYKDIFELHEGMMNCEMTLTELNREFEIHRVEYKKSTKKGANETQDIMNVRNFVEVYDSLEDIYSENFGGKSEESIQARREWKEKRMKIPYYTHLYENR
jgi:flagellar biosynthesis chaperone FliJ